jgi:hypothetical protein
LRYRFYIQSAVEFYKPIYTQLTIDSLRTRDRELSRLSYQRAGAELEQDVPVGNQGAKLALTLALSGNLYEYAQFVGLNEIMALEISASLALQLWP